jgi:nitrile hydratase accessory protein
VSLDPRELASLPAIPRDAGEPVFREPWEAQAFALAVGLHERGRFAWREFAERLAAQIAAARERGEPDDGGRYYEHWLAALEALLAAKDLVPIADLRSRQAELQQGTAKPDGH